MTDPEGLVVEFEVDRNIPYFVPGSADCQTRLPRETKVLPIATMEEERTPATTSVVPCLGVETEAKTMKRIESEMPKQIVLGKKALLLCYNQAKPDMTMDLLTHQKEPIQPTMPGTMPGFVTKTDPETFHLMRKTVLKMMMRIRKKSRTVNKKRNKRCLRNPKKEMK